MWTCSQCGQQFVYQNQWHSCGNYTVEGFLEGRTQQAIELYHHFIETYRTLCDFKVHPVKTRVSLLIKMRFASVNRLGKGVLDGHLVLREPYRETLCFHKVEMISKNQHVHHFRLRSKDDITVELKRYMKIAGRETGTRLDL